MATHSRAFRPHSFLLSSSSQYLREKHEDSTNVLTILLQFVWCEHCAQYTMNIKLSDVVPLAQWTSSRSVSLQYQFYCHYLHSNSHTSSMHFVCICPGVKGHLCCISVMQKATSWHAKLEDGSTMDTVFCHFWAPLFSSSGGCSPLYCLLDSDPLPFHSDSISSLGITVADLGGVLWVQWNPLFEGLPSFKL